MMYGLVSKAENVNLKMYISEKHDICAVQIEICLQNHSLVRYIYIHTLCYPNKKIVM